jgi:hypothetical protein
VNIAVNPCDSDDNVENNAHIRDGTIIDSKKLIVLYQNNAILGLAVSWSPPDYFK